MKNEDKKRKLRLGDIIRKMNEGPPASSDSIKPVLPGEDKKKSSDSIKSADTDTSAGRVLLKQPSLNKEDIGSPKPNFDNTETQKPSIPPQDTRSETAENHQAVSTPPATPAPAQKDAPPSIQMLSSSASQGIDREEEEEFDIFRYLGVILRRKEIIILTTVIMGLFSLFSYLKSTKYYRTSARLLFSPYEGTIIDDKSTWKYYTDRNRNFNTHLELLKSRIVLERVSENLGEIVPVGVIAGGLTIKPGEFGGEETNIIELTFKHTDAVVARDVVNELCKTYVEYRREVNAQEDTRLILKLNVQIDKVQNDLTTKEDALRKFKENNRMVQLSQDADLLTTKLADMEIALQQTQLNLLETKERLSSLQSQIGKQQVTVVQSMTYENPMQSRLSELELELNTLSGEYSQDHFKIKQIKQQIENLKQAMQSEIEKEVTKNAAKRTLIKNPIRESLLQTFVNQSIEISALEAKRTAQEQIIEKLSLRMEKLPALEQEYAFLLREREALDKTLKMLKMKLEETKIQRDSKESELKILELAKLPKEAISSKKISSIFIGLFIGLIIGIALVFLIEYLDQSLKDPTEVEKNLELPLIGIVPLIETENAIVDNDNLTKSMLEPFRALRANIKHIASQHQTKVFMICSAVKGEGKTTLAINLAITFAMDGKKAILIDGDLRRSQIHSLINVRKETGLSDYLLEKKDIDDIIKPTVHPNLFVITSGERPHNPAELLGIPRFGLLLQELKNRADIIICDSPALIPVSDSMTMAPHMDCCIMVVRALWTPLKAAKQAKNQLSRIGAKLGGGILNGISHSRGYYPYYYGYYGYYAYSYKYSYDYDKEPRKKLTVREFGLSVERNIKSFFQNLRVSIPRTFVLLGSLCGHLLRRGLFWILLALLTIVASLRYYLFSPDREGRPSLITYLENEQTPGQQPHEPITVVPSSDSIHDTYGTQHPADSGSVRGTESPLNNQSFAFQESLSVWKDAFNAPDADRFFALYDRESFVYPGGGFKEWHDYLRPNILKKDNREFIITIQDISCQKIKDNFYNTTFTVETGTQTDTLCHQKSMIWKLSGSGWHIIREKSKSIK